MSLKNLVEKAMRQIESSIENPLSESEGAAVSKIIEGALIEAVNRSTKKCADTAVVCCGPEADLAHKIAEDVERARHALIANLTSMR
jgi:hypothetical protein